MADGVRREAPGGEGWNGGPRARSELPYRLRLWIPSSRPAINRAVDAVGRLARRSGWVDGRRTDLEIALREALANAMLHGNGMRPERRVFLRCYAGPRGGILIAVRDQGAGFDPQAVPDPRAADRMELAHGRGLLLMRELTDAIEFRRGGREVVFYQRPTP
jgi:serine/threonine-protein kinase RsbW